MVLSSRSGQGSLVAWLMRAGFSAPTHSETWQHEWLRWWDSASHILFSHQILLSPYPLPSCINPHRTKPWKSQQFTSHLHLYGNERVNPHHTKPYEPLWLTTHPYAYGNERVNSHHTKPYEPPLSNYMPMVMKGLTLTAPSHVNHIYLLHIYMPKRPG